MTKKSFQKKICTSVRNTQTESSVHLGSWFEETYLQSRHNCGPAVCSLPQIPVLAQNRTVQGTEWEAAGTGAVDLFSECLDARWKFFESEMSFWLLCDKCDCLTFCFWMLEHDEAWVLLVSVPYVLTFVRLCNCRNSHCAGTRTCIVPVHVIGKVLLLMSCHSPVFFLLFWPSRTFTVIWTSRRKAQDCVSKLTGVFIFFSTGFRFGHVGLKESNTVKWVFARFGSLHRTSDQLSASPTEWNTKILRDSKSSMGHEYKFRTLIESTAEQGPVSNTLYFVISDCCTSRQDTRLHFVSRSHKPTASASKTSAKASFVALCLDRDEFSFPVLSHFQAMSFYFCHFSPDIVHLVLLCHVVLSVHCHWGSRTNVWITTT